MRRGPEGRSFDEKNGKELKESLKQGAYLKGLQELAEVARAKDESSKFASSVDFYTEKVKEGSNADHIAEMLGTPEGEIAGLEQRLSDQQFRDLEEATYHLYPDALVELGIDALVEKFGKDTLMEMIDYGINYLQIEDPNAPRAAERLQVLQEMRSQLE